ncbi:MAG: fibronectin type III domain-containing protein [Candidatus Thorarchaeota archaeon]|nr:fibronectin type III domain-containing protein [Candidatus Thorarchaeota archaeon]
MRRSVSFTIAFALFLLPLLLGLVETTSPNPAVAPEGSFTEAASAQFVRGPTVNLVTNSSALIFWRTDAPMNATVDYGLEESNLNLTVSNSTVTGDHRITLTGLAVGSKYYYQVTSNGTASDRYHFNTAPAERVSPNLGLTVSDEKTIMQKVTDPLQTYELRLSL